MWQDIGPSYFLTDKDDELGIFNFRKSTINVFIKPYFQFSLQKRQLNNVKTHSAQTISTDYIFLGPSLTKPKIKGKTLDPPIS
jgi:hypothetical protein